VLCTRLQNIRLNSCKRLLLALECRHIRIQLIAPGRKGGNGLPRRLTLGSHRLKFRSRSHPLGASGIDILLDIGALFLRHLQIHAYPVELTALAFAPSKCRVQGISSRGEFRSLRAHPVAITGKPLHLGTEGCRRISGLALALERLLPLRCDLCELIAK
jgi:hypothetical protein